jgi:hypothetical protein
MESGALGIENSDKKARNVVMLTAFIIGALIAIAGC